MVDAQTYFQGLNSSRGIPFMEGSTKGSIDEILDARLHIFDYGFITSEDGGEFACVCFAEKQGRFYFMNSITSDMLKQVDADGMKDAISAVEIMFTRHTSKKGRDYVTYQFC